MSGKRAFKTKVYPTEF